MTSPGFETNDMGRLNQADQIRLQGRLRYRETVPGRFWRNYMIGINSNNNMNFAGDRQGGGVGFHGNIEWSNFWSIFANVNLWVRKQNMRLTRGGPTMQQTRAWEWRANIQSPDSGRSRFELQIEHRDDEDGGVQLTLRPQFRMQPGSKWQLSLEPNYARNVDTQQYFDTVEGGGPAATFGNRYVFGRLDQTTYSTAIRLDYTFKPDLTLQLYAEPFSSSGSYTDIGELAAPRTRQRRSYGTDGTTLTRLADGSYEVTDGNSIFQLDNEDFNVQSFRSNLVLRWEWRPGSILYLVWAQDRFAETDSGSPTTAGQMFRSLGVTGDNFFAIKTSFWFSP